MKESEMEGMQMIIDKAANDSSMKGRFVFAGSNLKSTLKGKKLGNYLEIDWVVL